MTGRGHPRVLTLTPAQPGDAPQAADLLAGRRRGTVRAVIADKGYDSDAIVALVRRLPALGPLRGRSPLIRRHSAPLIVCRAIASPSEQLEERNDTTDSVHTT